MPRQAPQPHRATRRVGTACIVALLLAAALGLGSAAGPAAIPGTPTGAGTFVGSWRTTVVPAGGSPVPSLTTYEADGTLIVSRPPVVPAKVGGLSRPVVTSAGQGARARPGARTAAIVVVFLEADLQGRALGSQTIRGTDRLAPDGQTFQGEGALTVRDPQGRVVATSTVTARGTRLALAAPSQRQTAEPAQR